MAKGPRRPRRDRDQAAARGTPAGQRDRAKGRDPKLPPGTRGPSAKQVARDLAKLEQRLAEARTDQSKRQCQLDQAAADVASLVSDVARLHAALTAIEIASAPDIAALVDGLDEEVARLDRADAVAPVRRRRRAPTVPPVVEPSVAEEPAVAEEPVAAEAAEEVAAEAADEVAVADVTVVTIVEEEALLEIPEAAESEVSPGLPADVGELDALADVEQPDALVDVAEPEAVHDQVTAGDEPAVPEEAPAPEAGDEAPVADEIVAEEPELAAISEEATVAEEP